VVLLNQARRADLVLISENPIEDTHATRPIGEVWCGGIECAMGAS